MDNPETQATLGTQDTWWRQTKQKAQHRRTKMMSYTDPIKSRVWIKVLAKGKQPVPLTIHPPCYLHSQYVWDTTIHKQTQLTNKRIIYTNQ